MDLLFPNLDFSLSDQQVPMFMRLCKLALALHLGEFKTTRQAGDRNRLHKDESNESNELDDSTEMNDDGPEELDADNANQSWAGWAWGYVPAILPVYWEDEMNDAAADAPLPRDRLVHFGVFIERVTWTLKWAELVGDQSISGPTRLRFQPFLTIRMQGCYIQVLLAGIQWVNVQGGISHLTLEPAAHCLCGVPEDASLYFVQGCERDTFMRKSLYDATELDPQDQNKPVFQWEEHIGTVTESTLLERTPALAFDYLYQLEVPEDNVSELLSQVGSELEYSNWAEKALLRLAVGPLQLKVSYGLCHRLSALLHAVRQYNYPEYTSVVSDPLRQSMSQSGVDELVSMANNLPMRIYQVAVLRPLIFFSLSAQHPAFDLQRLMERRIARIVKDPLSALSNKVRLIYHVYSFIYLLMDCEQVLPVLKFTCTCVDVQLTQPMYPVRLSLTAKSLLTPTGELLSHNCYNQVHSTLRITNPFH